MQMTGHSVVDAISQISITGNITPPSWYQHIRYVNKRGNYPDLLAIAILSEIIYWHRAAEVRDECSGQLTGWKKKFKGEKFQRSLDSFCNFYGVSEKLIRTSIRLLEQLGLIVSETLPIQTPFGTIPNALHITPVPSAIADISYRVKMPEVLEKSFLPNSAGRADQLGSDESPIRQFIYI